jgi:hypothetical protein
MRRYENAKSKQKRLPTALHGNRRVAESRTCVTCERHTVLSAKGWNENAKSKQARLPTALNGKRREAESRTCVTWERHTVLMRLRYLNGEG